MKSILLKILTLTTVITTALCVATACKHTHSYVQTTVNPTCVEQGYTSYVCSCGDTYVDSYVNALGHTFETYVSNNDATCTKDGTKTAKCTNCDVTDTVTDAGSKLSHTFKNYVSKNDGTKKATCSCGATDYIVDKNVLVVVKDVLIGVTDYGKTLKNIVIPQGVVGISKNAFKDCKALTSVVIPKSVTKIGMGAFENCLKLTSIKYCGSKTEWKLIDKKIGWDKGIALYTITYNYRLRLELNPHKINIKFLIALKPKFEIAHKPKFEIEEKPKFEIVLKPKLEINK